MNEKLKAPFPYFGGKSKVASLVWERLGDVDNFIEPFCGSAALLLGRPHPPRVETLNDADCYVANFWRATSTCPEEVAEWADAPVNEADLHARHRWLVLSHSAAEFRRRMRTEPGYFDARVAGWWCWGLCCWIGGGWCAVPGETAAEIGCNQARQPTNAGSAGGVHGKSKVRIAAHNKGSVGKGVHAKGPSEQLPMMSAPGRGIHAAALSQQIPLIGDPPRGMDASGPSEKRPRLHGGTGADPPGVHKGLTAAGRPQLADAYARGRGVHGNDAAGTCEQRRAWLVDWFSRLRDRLRTVRVCCGDWLRVCDSESVTTRLGLTGVFLDPPYGDAAKRVMGLYATDSGSVAADVRRWCLERGPNHLMRICLAGYEGEGHEVLEAAGWSVVAWKTAGGYANQSGKKNDNAARERLWFSPHCNNQRGLFDSLVPESTL